MIIITLQRCKDDSDYVAFKVACTAAFSAHSNLLYDDDKYANGTTICTSLSQFVLLKIQGVLL